MVGRATSVITRWLLVCALAFAVAVMHHLASTSHGAGAHGATAAPGHAVAASAAEHCCPAHAGDHPSSPPSGEHDLAHLCLAVLLGLLVLVTALVAWRSRRSPGGPAPPLTFARPPVPPPPLLRGGRATLHSVCVLRL